VEVVPGDGYNRGRKRRYVIEKIEPEEVRGELAGPYYASHRSVVQFVGNETKKKANVSRKPIQIDAEGIAGLDKQLDELNSQLLALRHAVNESRLVREYGFLQKSRPVLLHGASGTGKTLVLDKLAAAPWRRVIRVDESMDSSSNVKKEKAIRDLFQDAVANQPSLIIMDDLERYAGRADEARASDSLAHHIAAVMRAEKVSDKQVQVVAAVSDPNDIDERLRSSFKREIELPVPDIKARTAILRTKLQDRASDDLLKDLGEKTHGFVGRDLEELVEAAYVITLNRVNQTQQRNDLRDASVARNRESSSQDSVDQWLQAAGKINGDDTDSVIEQRPGSPSDTLTLSDFEAALTTVRPTPMRGAKLETPNVTWSDIGGSEHVKEALAEVIEVPFKDPQSMATFSLTPRKGILLYGPPGCSKTLTAQAIASSSSLNFLAVKGAELTSMYVGETERKLRDLFGRARAAAPSVLFFDEIDAMAGSREKDANGGGTKGLNVLTTLLNEMDGIEALKGVLVLAATNRPDMLDPALLRPGRFDACLYVGPPNEEARRQIIEMNTRRLPNPRPMAEDWNLGRLVTETAGYSGAELVGICDDAARAALRSYRKGEREAVIKMQDFETAMGDVKRGISEEMLEGYRRWAEDRAATVKL